MAQRLLSSMDPHPGVLGKQKPKPSKKKQEEEEEEEELSYAKKLKTRTVTEKNWWNGKLPEGAKIITPEDEERMASGDLAIFSGKKSWVSSVIRFFQPPSIWTHVGVVVRMGDGKLYLYQSNWSVNPRDVSDAFISDARKEKFRLEEQWKRGRLEYQPANHEGVKLTPLWEAMKTYGGYYKGFRRLMWEGRDEEGRELTLRHDEKFLELFKPFLDEHWRKPYEESLIQLYRAVDEGNQKSDTSSFFCSELAAELYQHMGIMKREKFSNNYNVTHLTDEFQVFGMRKGYWFGEIEYFLDDADSQEEEEDEE